MLARHLSDMSYTPVPDWVRTAHPDHTTFARLTRLAYPETRAQSLGDPHPSKRLEAKLPPDDHLLCFDVLYFVSSDLVGHCSVSVAICRQMTLISCSRRLALGVYSRVQPRVACSYEARSIHAALGEHRNPIPSHDVWYISRCAHTFRERPLNSLIASNKRVLH